jgi:predicted nucleic acid-binding protein
LIAATGLILGLPVVSANPRHFRWIVGLTHYNWRE